MKIDNKIIIASSLIPLLFRKNDMSRFSDNNKFNSEDIFDGMDFSPIDEELPVEDFLNDEAELNNEIKSDDNNLEDVLNNQIGKFNNKTLKNLAIDGGGVFVLNTLRLLILFEKRLKNENNDEVKINLNSLFDSNSNWLLNSVDIISGTSAGSIVLYLMILGYNFKEIYDIFVKSSLAVTEKRRRLYISLLFNRPSLDISLFKKELVSLIKNSNLNKNFINFQLKDKDNIIFTIMKKNNKYFKLKFSNSRNDTNLKKEEYVVNSKKYLFYFDNNNQLIIVKPSILTNNLENDDNKDNVFNFIKSKYQYEVIRELNENNLNFDVLDIIFYNKTFLIPAFNVTDRKIQIFSNSKLLNLPNVDSKFNQFNKKVNLIIGNDIKLIDAVLSSASAPIYFDSYQIKIEGKKISYCDGGIALLNTPNHLNLIYSKIIKKDKKVKSLCLTHGNKKNKKESMVGLNGINNTIGLLVGSASLSNSKLICYGLSTGNTRYIEFKETVEVNGEIDSSFKNIKSTDAFNKNTIEELIKIKDRYYKFTLDSKIDENEFIDQFSNFKDNNKLTNYEWIKDFILN